LGGLFIYLYNVYFIEVVPETVQARITADTTFTMLLNDTFKHPTSFIHHPYLTLIHSHNREIIEA